MKDEILNFLKRAGLFFIALPLAHWLGVIVGGVLSLIAAFMLKTDYPVYASIIEYACLFTVPFVSLFFLVQYFTGYDENTDLQTELLVPTPYDDLYLRWMEAMIDFHNGEYGKYNNAVDMFTTSYEAFQNYYNRTHMPIGKNMKYF